jgi:hypothetical protein
MGADSPTFAFYNDSTVIFVTKSADGKSCHFSKRVGSAEFNALRNRLTLSPVDSVDSEYTISLGTDQPQTVFDFSGTKVRVWGHWKPYDLKSCEGPLQAIAEQEKELRAHLPRKLEELHDFLSSYPRLGAKEWLPEHIEVLFWPFEYARRRSIIWPKEWPDLSDSRTVKRHDNMYSVYLPSKFLPDLMALLKRTKGRAAVEVNGKKMAASFRFPFPSGL